MEKDIGGKLCYAIEALGVVDVDGGCKLTRTIEEKELGEATNRKEGV